MTQTVERQRRSWLWKVVDGAASFLIGGICLGFGICVLFIVDIISSVFEEQLNRQFDAQATIGLLNWTWVIILIGVAMSAFGCIQVYRAYNTMKPEVVAEPKVEGKLFCRYCGKENKPDAIYCQGCGKKLQ